MSQGCRKVEDGDGYHQESDPEDPGTLRLFSHSGISNKVFRVTFCCGVSDSFGQIKNLDFMIVESVRCDR